MNNAVGRFDVSSDDVDSVVENNAVVRYFDGNGITLECECFIERDNFSAGTMPSATWYRRICVNNPSGSASTSLSVSPSAAKHRSLEQTR